MTDRRTDTVALKKIMVDRDIRTISKLSEMAGVSRTTLGEIFSGEKQPSADVMDKLIVALGIPLEKAGEIFFRQNLLSA